VDEAQQVPLHGPDVRLRPIVAAVHRLRVHHRHGHLSARGAAAAVTPASSSHEWK
jgi:hypothetical protein